MKRLAIIAVLTFVGFAGWQAGGVLSSDAMSMAVGVVFGVLASLPAALLILVASRRSAPPEPPSEQRTGLRQPQMNGTGQMPIVIVAPPNYAGYGPSAGNQFAQLPAPQPSPWQMSPQPVRQERVFTIIGEQADSVDDF